MAIDMQISLPGFRALNSLALTKPSFLNRARPSGICMKQRRLRLIVSSAQKKPSGIFDREIERRALELRLQSEPTSILVLLGPRSSGKTALLQEVLFNMEGTQFPPSYMSARSKELSDPSVLVQHLQDDGIEALQWMSSILKTFSRSRFSKFLPLTEKSDGQSINISGEKALQAFMAKQDQSINDVIAVYGEMLGLYKVDKPVGSRWPVICIDEANVFTEWEYGNEKQRRNLKTLFRFFVMITKEANLAHVILATSEHSFQNWLAKQIGYGFFTTEVIGDFPQEEARLFFRDYILPLTGKHDHLSDYGWLQVHQVCGGNPGQLRMAAFLYDGDWDAALEGVWNPILGHVESGLNPGNSWTEEQFKSVLRLLLASEHAAVPTSTLLLQFGRGFQTVLDALVKESLLSYRPMSRWARDLPPEVHLGGVSVVTAPTPAHLFCMKKLERRGLLVSKDGGWPGIGKI